MARSKKPAKVEVEPGRAALPRTKREVPDHVKAAADRAEARARAAAGEPEPPKKPKKGKATKLDKEDTDERVEGRARALAVAIVAERDRIAPPHRETDYEPGFVDRVRAMVGAVTTFDVAQELGVTERTIYRWKRIHTDFCQAITDKREMYDDEIERSMGQRALGYYYEDTHVSTFRGEVTLTPIVKHMPGDVSAQKHWLANRRPLKWRSSDDGLPPPGEQNSLTDRNYTDLARRVLAAIELAEMVKRQSTAVTINGSAQRVEAAE